MQKSIQEERVKNTADNVSNILPVGWSIEATFDRYQYSCHLADQNSEDSCFMTFILSTSVNMMNPVQIQYD